MRTDASSTPPTALMRVRVWDLPTRIFHWLLMILVVALVITGHQGGEWMPWHARCGFGVLTLLLFRLIWGVVGGHHSRFRQFVPKPASLWRALRTPHHPSTGHSPLGALSVFALLLVLGLQATSGLFSDDEIAFSGPLSAQVSASMVSLATWYHKSVGKRALIGLVLLHVLAIVYYRVRYRESLVPPMITGDKSLETAVASRAMVSQDGTRQRLHALVWLILCAGVIAALVRWGSGA
jgi:cytochrome b